MDIGTSKFSKFFSLFVPCSHSSLTIERPELFGCTGGSRNKNGHWDLPAQSNHFSIKMDVHSNIHSTSMSIFIFFLHFSLQNQAEILNYQEHQEQNYFVNEFNLYENQECERLLL